MLKTIGKDKTNQLCFTAGISSTAVVDGATIALTYGKASSSNVLNVLDGQIPVQKLGKIKASATSLSNFDNIIMNNTTAQVVVLAPEN